MTTPLAHTPLPLDPSHPITNPPGSSQTHTNRSPSGQSSPGRSGKGSSTGSKPSKPSSTGTGGGKGGLGENGNPFQSSYNVHTYLFGGSRMNKTAIALGTVFGVLGFATGVAFVLWYLRRWHARSGHASDPLGDDKEESPHPITTVRLGGTCETSPRILAAPLGLLGMIGLGPSGRHANRDGTSSPTRIAASSGLAAKDPEGGRALAAAVHAVVFRVCRTPSQSDSHLSATSRMERSLLRIRGNCQRTGRR